MESNTPTAAKFTTSDEPPWETNGRVMPVTGIKASTTQMLMIAWKVIQAVMPAASRPPKVSGARRAVLIPPQAKATNKPMTTIPPTKPSSWAIVEKM